VSPLAHDGTDAPGPTQRRRHDQARARVDAARHARPPHRQGRTRRWLLGLCVAPFPSPSQALSVRSERRTLTSHSAITLGKPPTGLATQSKADFLRGRYVSANWDVNELVKKAPEVIERDLLWTRVVGQEQVMPKTSQVHLY